jgi:CheY-like chemotaxis protein
MQVPPEFPQDSIQERKSTTVLIVDDEPDIVHVFKKSLEISGYSSYGFVNPIAAIDHFGQNSDLYQIVISDIRMPGMSGFDFAREVRRIKPEAIIVLTSAFEINKSELDTVLPSLKIDAILEKPVSVEKLNQVLKTVAT